MDTPYTPDTPIASAQAPVLTVTNKKQHKIIPRKTNTSMRKKYLTPEEDITRSVSYTHLDVYKRQV